MKIHIRALIIVGIVFAFVPAALAADKAVLVDPIALKDGLIGGQFEWAVSPGTTMAVQAGVSSAGDSEVKVTGIIAGFGLNKYLAGIALDGVYIGGGGAVARASAKDLATSEQLSLFGFSLSGHAGYKLLLGPGVVLDVRGVLTMPVYASASSGGESVSGFGAGDFAASYGLGIGFAW